MFRSKRRQIIIPQSEHLKLAGTLAMLWGNEHFDSPPIERASFIAGVGLHDRGYGYLDNSPVGGMSDEEWEVIGRRGYNMPCSDVIADTIVKYHFKRLASHGTTKIRKAMHADFTQILNDQLEHHQLSRTLFNRIDRITNLCDTLSFEFCFDAPASGSLAIFPRNNEDSEVTIHYQVQDGEINVSPWTFSVDEHQGYLVAYQMNGYPERLDPVILPYRLKKK